MLICTKLVGAGDPAFAVPVTSISERIKPVTGSVKNMVNLMLFSDVILPFSCAEAVMVGVGGVISTIVVTGSEAVFGFPA